MSKILLVVPSLSIGGQERIAIETAKVLATDNEVGLAIFHKHTVEYETTCEVFNLNVGIRKTIVGKFFAQMVRARRLKRLRKEWKPDFVYSFGDTANITNVLSKRKSNGKTIVSFHGFASVKKNLKNDLIFRRAETIICISKAMQHKFSEIYPFKKTVVLENGYDIEDIRSKATLDNISLSGGPSFVAMGRMEDVKGFDRLINAFKNVVDKAPDCKLYLVGDGKKARELNEQVGKLGLENNVSFLGYQKNPYAYLYNADVFVLSSKKEGFPNALIESLACGAACLSVDCETGPREILSKDYTNEPVKGVVEEAFGVLCEFSQEEERAVDFLTEGLLRFATNKELVAKYKKVGPNRAKNFSIDVYKNKLKQIFIQMLEK